MTTDASLEARVAALEQIAGQPNVSTLQPNVLTVAPDGTIGADFTGHVHAQGLDLDASRNASPPTADRVRWLRTDNGAVVATLLSYYTGAGGASSLVGQAQSQGTTDNGAAALVALDDLGATQAQLQVTQINRGAMPNPSAIGGNTEVDVGAGNLLKRLLAIDGSSHFLQLLSAQQLQLAFGASSVTWPGASPFSGSVIITYGLGRTAQAVFISASATSAGALTGMDYFNLTSTTFQVQARTLDGSSPGAGVTAGFSWAALG